MKFSSFVNEQRIDKKSLGSIHQYGLFKPKDKSQEECIVKFSFPAVVKVQSDCPAEFTEMIKNAIQRINESTDNLRLVFAKQKDLNGYDGVYYTFRRDTSMKHSLEVTNKSVIYWDLRFPRMCKSEVLIKYRNATITQLDIANSLYRSICPTGMNDPFELMEDEIHLTPEFKEILKVYYHPSLPSGFTKSDLGEVINEL